MVRSILARHYQPGQDSDGPSWLTFFGHMKDSLWSIDLVRCASATLRTHWVLVVMDQYTRRIIGFGVHAGTLKGVALCKMFNRAIRGQLWMPKYISSDNAGYAPVTTNRQSPLVSMATSLSGPLSDTGGCLISQRFVLAAVSGRPLQKPRMKSSGLCVLSCTALRGSDRFTAAVSIHQRQLP